MDVLEEIIELSGETIRNESEIPMEMDPLALDHVDETEDVDNEGEEDMELDITHLLTIQIFSSRF